MKIPAPLRPLVNLYNNSKLHSKLMFSYILVLSFIILLVAGAAISFSTRSLHDQLSFSAERSFNQTSSFLSYKMYKIIGTTDYLVQDSRLNAIINKNKEYYSPVDQVQDMLYIQKFLRSYQDDNDISRIQLFVQGGLLYSDGNINIGNVDKVTDTIWYKKLNSNKTKVLCMPYQYVRASEPGKEVLSIARVMKQTNNYSKLAGFLRFDMDKKMIVDILRDSDPTSDSVTFLVNSERYIVAASNPEILKKFKISDGSIPAFSEADGYNELSLVGEEVREIHRLISGTDWTMITIVPNSSFMKDIKNLTTTLLVIVLIIAIVAYLLAYFISHTITRRITRLSNRMQRVAEGKFKPMGGISYRDEVGVLYDSYNHMVTRIDTLIKEQLEMGKELKSAELKALQSQINPHFLYNTLDVIKWLGYQKRTEDIDEVVSSLARFYKLSLNKGKDIVPIFDEVDHASSYIRIQNIRFKGKIAFVVDVDPSLLQYSIPKITLQPIVENAVYHGILEKPSKTGMVSITGRSNDNGIILSAHDDGVGIAENKLKDLLGATQPEQSGSHYGLRNIDQRIKLLYGPAYGLTFESIPGNGTTVNIHLPKNHLNQMQ